MNPISRYSITLWLVFTCSAGFAETRLPAFFGDHMVLQRDSKVAVWGWDEPGRRVSVLAGWGERARTEAEADGRWRVRLETPGAGGPWSLAVKGSSKVEIRDVLVGEVWFASGQSNMYMPLAGYSNQPVNGANEAILNAANERIRLFQVTRNGSDTPLDDVEGAWAAAAPSTACNFSATAWFFARKLESVLGVPVGIIHSSWGGSNVEAWIDAGTLSAYPDFTFWEATRDEEARRSPSMLYNAMLHPFIGFGMRGAIWYQGESNRARPAEYRTLFPLMVRSWREQWGIGDFSFYYAQIAPKDWDGGNSAFLREAQRESAGVLPNMGMAVTMDLGECDNIHPAEKRVGGERLAYWALAKDYGFTDIAYSGPVFHGMDPVEAGRLTLHFEHASRGLSTFGAELDGFEIAGEDRVFHAAQAQITGREGAVTVWSEAVPEPVAVRYAFGDCPPTPLFDTWGLPASSFRSDDW